MVDYSDVVRVANAQAIVRALKKTTVHLMGASSAYKQYAKGDALKRTRIKRWERAIRAAQKAIKLGDSI